MTTEPELLNERLERLAMVLDEIMPNCALLVRDTLELLKDQEDFGAELTNAVELIHKKNERIEKLMKEQEAIVRCKDCKHRGNSEKCVLSAISEEKGFPLFMLDNRDDWFCADGERKKNSLQKERFSH